MAENEAPINIILGENIFVPSDQDTDRGRELAERFLALGFQNKLPPGHYTFNVVHPRGTTVVTIKSSQGSPKLRYQHSTGPDDSSIEYQVTYGDFDDKEEIDWKSPRTYIGLGIYLIFAWAFIWCIIQTFE